MGAEDGAMVGNHHRWASILGQGRAEQLEYRGEVLVGRGHPGEDLPGVALEHTEAVDPAIRQFDQIPHVHEPHMMPLARSIGEVCECRRGLRLLTRTGPRARGAVAFAIARHSAADGGLTWRGLLAARFEQALDSKASRAGRLPLDIQHLFEKGQGQLMARMRRGPRPMLLEPGTSVTLTGVQNRVYMAP